MEVCWLIRIYFGPLSSVWHIHIHHSQVSHQSSIKRSIWPYMPANLGWHIFGLFGDEDVYVEAMSREALIDPPTLMPSPPLTHQQHRFSLQWNEKVLKACFPSSGSQLRFLSPPPSPLDHSSAHKTDNLTELFPHRLLFILIMVETEVSRTVQECLARGVFFLPRSLLERPHSSYL